ncbi:MAG: hypothetical protein ABI841_07485 [Chloroflexota bacterium]
MTPLMRRIPRPGVVAVAGLASLANGFALVVHIVGGLPLGALLAIVWSIALVAIAAMGAVGGPSIRATLVRTVGVGLVVGLAATLLYDATKAFLSVLDPSPYDPFETTRVFGRILIGADASPTAVTIVGWAFHLMNGSTFAIAFAALFARGGQIGLLRGLATGIGWGIFLETFQLILYPGWLSIGFLDEFRRISFLSHIVFGAILGLFVPAGLRWARRRMARNESGAR